MAAANGYIDGVDGASITVTDGLSWSEPNQLEVEISDTVDTFLLRVLGRQNQTITRGAIAEYVPPLPLGSPESQFGNSCDPNEPGCTGQPNFWANMHGKYTDTRMGDAYSSYCEDGQGSHLAPNGSAKDALRHNDNPKFTKLSKMDTAEICRFQVVTALFQREIDDQRLDYQADGHQ